MPTDNVKVKCPQCDQVVVIGSVRQIANGHIGQCPACQVEIHTAVTLAELKSAMRNLQAIGERLSDETIAQALSILIGKRVYRHQVVFVLENAPLKIRRPILSKYADLDLWIKDDACLKTWLQAG